MTSPRFDGRSEKLGSVAAVDSPNLEPTLVHNEDVLKIINQLDLGSTALLKAEFKIGDKNNHPSFGTRASFTERPDLSKGRDEGRHGARFGQMIINGSGLHERPTLVSIKPFDYSSAENPADQLSNEWLMNDFLNSIGEDQQAFIPLGVWKNVEGISHLITLYEHDVISYDNVFWVDRNANSEALRPESIEHAFKDCLTGLGYLHGVGVTHGDAEAKNLAAGRRGVRFIDLEDGKFIPDVDNPSGLERAVRLTRNDIETFLDSTVQIDENRHNIKVVLEKQDFRKKLPRFYRAGIRAAQIDTGIKSYKLPTTSDEYFEQTIIHTLMIASKDEIQQNTA